MSPDHFFLQCVGLLYALPAIWSGPNAESLLHFDHFHVSTISSHLTEASGRLIGYSAYRLFVSYHASDLYRCLILPRYLHSKSNRWCTPQYYVYVAHYADIWPFSCMLYSYGFWCSNLISGISILAVVLHLNQLSFRIQLLWDWYKVRIVLEMWPQTDQAYDDWIAILAVRVWYLYSSSKLIQAVVIISLAVSITASLTLSGIAAANLDLISSGNLPGCHVKRPDDHWRLFLPPFFLHVRILALFDPRWLSFYDRHYCLCSRPWKLFRATVF